MRLLFVHERFGALGGAEANVLLTGTELKRRGHSVALVHGAATGREEASWSETFAPCFPLEANKPGDEMVRSAVAAFQPDVVFVHKLSDLSALEALGKLEVPVVRMVHDHDLYCLRGYKYNPLNRKICTRGLSPYCVFPCAGTIARKSGGSLPLQWVSYGDKRRELQLNRRFHLIAATEFMRDELVRNGFRSDQIGIHAPVPRSPDE